jgi:hypothetical protein
MLSGQHIKSANQSLYLERFNELVAILAAGVIRVVGQQSRETADVSGESSLDMDRQQSGHAANLHGEAHQ